jgi:hypothetical protein
MAGSTRRRWLPSALVIAASLFLLGVGLVLLFSPDLGARFFGADRATDGGYGFERTTGVRQVYLGLLVFITWWTGRSRDAGLVLMSLSFIPLSDFLVWLIAGAGVPKASEHLIGLLILPIGGYVAVAHRGRSSVDGPLTGASRS